MSLTTLQLACLCAGFFVCGWTYCVAWGAIRERFREHRDSLPNEDPTPVTAERVAVISDRVIADTEASAEVQAVRARAEAERAKREAFADMQDDLAINRLIRECRGRPPVNDPDFQRYYKP